MRAAREPTGLVEQRLTHGDEFFGWIVDDRVVSFGWVTYTERAIGCHRLKDAAGRVFLYNFHTAVAFRGNGFCGALLLAIRHVLGSEGATEFIIDAERRNRASISAIDKAGFATIARAGFGTLLGHWRWPRWRSVVAGMHQDLFSE